MLIVIPVYDDWEAAELLLAQLDSVFAAESAKSAGVSQEPVSVLFVDDASIEELPAARLKKEFRRIERVEVLRLRRNVGHQGAIAIALAHVDANLTDDPIVIMDGDGEDRPEDVVRLLEECRRNKGTRIVLARREARSEGSVFRGGYILYKLLFRVLIGRAISSGNFSVIPRALLPRVTGVSEVWNHFSCGLMKARLPLVFVGCDRGVRLAGTSRMNLLGLAEHGLSAMAVYSEKIGVRALAAAAVLGLLSFLLIVVAVFVRLMTSLAIPGWATYVVGLLTIVLLQTLSLGVFFVFLVLYNKNGTRFLPARDYPYYVLEVVRVHG